MTPQEILIEVKKGSTDEEIIIMIEEYGQEEYDRGAENASYGRY